MARKVILTAAVTGAVHIPSMSEYLPDTPDRIIEEAVAAHHAGAAVVHLHARDPKDGRPSSDPQLMKYITDGVRSRCDVVIGITTGGAIGMGIQNQIPPPVAAGFRLPEKPGDIRTVEHSGMGSKQLPQRKLGGFVDRIQRHLKSDQIGWDDSIVIAGDTKGLRGEQDLFFPQIITQTVPGVAGKADDLHGICPQMEKIAVFYSEIHGQCIDAIRIVAAAADLRLIGIQIPHQ